MSNQGENVQPLAKTWTAFSWDRPYPCKAREMLFHALVNAPSSEDGASWGRGGGIRRWIDCANAADGAPCSRPRDRQTASFRSDSTCWFGGGMTGPGGRSGLE